MTKTDCFIRARQPEHKEQRRQQILQATAHLLEESGFDKLSLNGIARECGIAKSNLYRYFDSREDILLQLLMDDWINWLDALEAELAPLAGSNDIRAVADLIANSFTSNPRLCELVSVLASVLEKNVTEASLYQFKSDSVQLGMRLLQVVSSALPAIPVDRLIPAVQGLLALIAGLWPLCHPSPLVEKIMEKPELAPFKLEFSSALATSISLMLSGAAVANQSG